MRRPFRQQRGSARAAPTGILRDLADKLPTQLVIGRACQSGRKLGQSHGAIARHRTSSELEGPAIEHTAVDHIVIGGRRSKNARRGICQLERGTIAGVLLSGGFLLAGVVIGWVDP